MKDIIYKVSKLLDLYKQGVLGGEFMPEDSNPGLDKSENLNLLYFTLPMALNYQRNSYKLWESVLATFNDKTTNDIFNPSSVVNMDDELLKQKLIKYKIALQPNKQPVIWKTLCKTINDNFDGDLRNLFIKNNSDVAKIKRYVLENKKCFPYLSGSKILNYWLYVVGNYTSINLINRQAITIAPDTHVLKASLKLGVICEEELAKVNIRDIVSERWQDILKDTNLLPIDLHTPFWLWSRGGFKIKI